MRTLMFLLIVCMVQVSFGQTCSAVPAKNKKIVEYVKTKVGKDIGKTDLIVASYKYAGIKYRDTWLGNEIYPSEECVYPGDIIVFKSCNVEWKLKDTTIIMSYGCHTEYIIYKVKGNGAYQIIVQFEDENEKRTAVLLDYSPKNFINGERPRFIRPNSY